MQQILTGTARDPHLTPKILGSMYRLRDEVFHKRLGWDVQSSKGMERDWYDELKPVYMVAADGQQAVQGCWRLLPTTGPYMLKNTFPSLLRGEEAPCDPGIWEISRLAIMPACQTDRRQAHFGEVMYQMMQALYVFAEHRGIRGYVVVTSLALERLLHSIDVSVTRFGDGKVQQLGKVRTVACWIHVNEQTRRAVFAYEGPTQHLAKAA